MTMTVGEADQVMAQFDTSTDYERVDTSAVAVLARSEADAQISAAHKFPRSVSGFLKEACGLATLTRAVAESCIYSIPRDGKMIAGPSVRLAEICASAYGNLHVGARIIEVTDTEIVAQGVAWDIQKNVRVSVENRRRITTKSGRRFSDDMVVVTGNAAASIALRNAIFRVVPRSYVDTIYAKCREVAVGNAQTLAARRDEVLARLAKIGVPADRVFQRLAKKLVDVDLDDLELLIGLGTAIKDGTMQIDDAFPPVSQAPAPPQEDGRRISMRGKKEQPKETVDPKTGEVTDAPPQREPGEDG